MRTSAEDLKSSAANLLRVRDNMARTTEQLRTLNAGLRETRERLERILHPVPVRSVEEQEAIARATKQSGGDLVTH